MMRMLLPNVLLMGVYSGILVYIFEHHWQLAIPKEAGFHALLGVVLGLVLVFRTNTAYDRWWEGRKLWGSLVNHSRSFALKLSAIIPESDMQMRNYFAVTISNFAVSLKEHLRGGTKMEELDLNNMDYAGDLARTKHVPNLLLKSMQERTFELYQSKKIDGDMYRVLQREMEGLVDVMGACERIKKTPIPFSYSMYVKKVIFAYLVSLPFSFIHLFHYWTIPAVMFTTYVLAGIEMIAEEIEDPFGTDSNDLDTDGISISIRRNLKEILG